MKIPFMKPGRLLALAALLLGSAFSMAADEPGVVILYADGSSHCRTFSELTRLEIGSDAVVMVHSAGSESHKIADIDRILIGADAAGVVDLPADATLAVWPTVATDRINVKAANDCRVVIYDLNGRLVAGPVEAAEGQSVAISIDACAPGYYLLEADKQTVKFIKK